MHHMFGMYRLCFLVLFELCGNKAICCKPKFWVNHLRYYDLKYLFAFCDYVNS